MDSIIHLSTKYDTNSTHFLNHCQKQIEKNVINTKEEEQSKKRIQATTTIAKYLKHTK